MKRRRFIGQSLATALTLSHTPFYKWPTFGEDFIKLTILHTNDTHSRIDPFPMDGSRNQGLGGMAKRAALIQKIREQESNVLLFDCGDIFQGTPYFNFFLGELEIDLMTRMGYDAATVGNHDFDAGMDNLALQMSKASFPMISSNYDFSNTVFGEQALDHKVFEVNGLRVGVCGAGVALEGLVPKELYGETIYNPPIEAVENTARMLKQDKGCHYVVCLSHIGYRYRSNRVCDLDMAANTEHVDLILGGHTHTFMREPEIILNKVGRQVMVHQVGWAGILLGKIDIVFERNWKWRCETCNSVKVS